MARPPNFRDYFQDELKYLYDRGREFAAAHDDIAAELHLSDLQDPDVAMLLKGFAFLTGRIRQNLDAQFPSLLYPLLGQIWPHALRPTPAATVVEFKQRPGSREPQELPSGTRVRTMRIAKTVGWFTTAYPVNVLPLRLDVPDTETPQTRAERPAVYLGTSELRLRLKILPGAKLVADKDGKRVELPLRLHVRKQLGQPYGLYSLLGQTWKERPLRAIRVRMLDGKGVEIAGKTLSADCLRPLGFAPEESLLPYQDRLPKHDGAATPEDWKDDREEDKQRVAFPHYRHLHEYLFFPTKYMFFDLEFDGFLLSSPPGDRLEIIFDLDPAAVEHVTLAENPADNIRLNASPVINLFHQKVSRTLDQRQAEHLIRPEGDLEHHDIFSIVAVAGHLQKSRQPIKYQPFFSFKNRHDQRLYQVHLRERATNNEQTSSDERSRVSTYRAVDTYLSLIEPENAEPPFSLSVDLFLTNRDLFSNRSEVIFDRNGAEVSGALEVIGLGELSTPAAMPVGRDGLWRFFAHTMLGLNQFRDVESLRTLIELYHLPSWDKDRDKLAKERDRNPKERDRIQPLLRAIQSVNAKADSQVCRLPDDDEEADKPRPPVLVRGTHLQIRMDDTQLGRGALALFGSVLNYHLAESAPVNTFTRLTIESQNGEVLTWPPRTGTQRLL